MNTDKILAEAIAKDYAPKDNSKIVALKKLDKKAKLPATIFTYTFGIISALIVGTGMSLAMQAIGSGVVSMVTGIVSPSGVLTISFISATKLRKNTLSLRALSILANSALRRFCWISS